jgi:hypothetical protein
MKLTVNSLRPAGPAGRRRTSLEQGTQPVTGIQLFSF